MAGAIGCTSSRSVFFQRDESNSCWTKTCAQGIPITLKVPTHVKLYVYEKHYLEAVDAGNGNTKIQYMPLPVVLRDFAQDFIYTEKVITVDFKRPAAGAFNLEVDLTDDQYIKKIQHDVTDETIQRVTELVGQIAPQGLFSPVASERAGENVDLKIKEIKSVVAVGVFEVDAPDFEHQIAGFLNCHINNAHDAWTIPRGVDEFRRVPLGADQQPGPVLCPGPHCYGAQGGIPHAAYTSPDTVVGEVVQGHVEAAPQAAQVRVAPKGPMPPPLVDENDPNDLGSRPPSLPTLPLPGSPGVPPPPQPKSL